MRTGMAATGRSIPRKISSIVAVSFRILDCLYIMKSMTTRVYSIDQVSGPDNGLFKIPSVLFCA
jgi:hypothetical protein